MSVTAQDVPPVAQGLIPLIVAVRPGDAWSVMLTESVAKPGNPLKAVALMMTVFDVFGNSGPKFFELEERTTNAMVADAELSKVVPVCTASLLGIAVPFAIVTQVLETLVLEHPV